MDCRDYREALRNVGEEKSPPTHSLPWSGWLLGTDAFGHRILKEHSLLAVPQKQPKNKGGEPFPTLQILRALLLGQLPGDTQEADSQSKGPPASNYRENDPGLECW